MRIFGNYQLDASLKILTHISLELLWLSGRPNLKTKKKCENCFIATNMSIIPRLTFDIFGAMIIYLLCMFRAFITFVKHYWDLWMKGKQHIALWMLHSVFSVFFLVRCSYFSVLSSKSVSPQVCLDALLPFYVQQILVQANLIGLSTQCFSWFHWWVPF